MSDEHISKNPLISVIIPTYNSIDYLDELYNWMQRQLLKNVEYIIVDDGSEDCTLSKLYSFSKNDRRIKVLKNTNKGVGSARQLGLRYSKGDYLSFLDSDDIFSDEMLLKSYIRAKSKDADILFWDFGTFSNNKYGNDHVRGFSEFKNLRTKLRFNITNPACWNKLFKRKFILENGIGFQNLESCNDIGFTWIALAYAKNIYYMRETLIYYRVSLSGSISAERWKKSQNLIIAASYIVKKLEIIDKTLLKTFYNDITSNFIYELSNYPRISKVDEYLNDIKKILPAYSYNELMYRYYKVSVVVPVYNCADFIEECLYSIVNQTEKNIEIIIIDDNSRDQTKEKINHFVNKYNNIYIYENSCRKGPSYSRNKGVSLARGKYISFIDADDFISENYIKSLLDVASKHSTDVVAASQIIRYPSGEIKETGFENADVISSKKAKMRLYLTTGVSVNKLYLKDFIKKNKIYYPEGSFYGEDNVFNLKLLMSVDKIYVTHQPVYYYRENDKSTTKENNNAYSLTLVKAYEICLSLARLDKCWKNTVFKRAKNDLKELHTAIKDLKLKAELEERCRDKIGLDIFGDCKIMNKYSFINMISFLFNKVLRK